jgi:uncharacterized membrane protein YoaK (UPF0700 family)
MSATVPLVPPAPSPAPVSPRAVNPSAVFGTTRGDLLAAGVLSAVAGYVDAAGFLGLYGLFAAHITGNLVAAGTTAAGGVHEGLSLRLTAILVFMISVATAAVVARAMRTRGHRPLTALFALMTLALAVFCATGVMLQSRLHGPDEWAVVLTGAIGVFGMGIQNALVRDVLSTLGPTTLMTGSLTQLTMDLVELAFPEEERGDLGVRHRIETRRRLGKSGTAVVAFLLGTALGSAATVRYGFWSIAFPTTVVATFTVSTWMHARAPRAHAARAMHRDRWTRRSHITSTGYRAR